MLKLAPIFTHHMVLQQHKNIVIFGTGTVGATVTVSIPERHISGMCKVMQNSTWRVTLPPCSQGTPCTLDVTDGQTSLHLDDVVFGEVWLAGGQSNMEYMVKDMVGGADALQTASSSGVRFFQVPRNTFQDETYTQDWQQACWELPSPETTATWSAVGFLAGRELAERLQVPIGIIGCNYGGSSVSCWLPEQDLESISAGSPYLEDFATAVTGKTAEEMIAAYDAYTEYQTAWTTRMEQCYAENPQIGWSEVLARCGENRWPGPMGIKSPYRPSGMYHTMLEPIAPYVMAGVFYYQGENDEHRPDTYAPLLRQLILRWRMVFEQEKLPFVIVQLPMFAYEDTPENGAWSKLRDAQFRVTRQMRHTGLAVSLDCGELGNIHPADKRKVGHRVALQAGALAYGLSPELANGPLYDGVMPIEHGFLVQFQYGQGLVWQGEPCLWELAGADRVYQPAKAELDGNAVRLTWDAEEPPLYARYAWRNYGAVTLYGKNGIPAAPFSTSCEISI